MTFLGRDERGILRDYTAAAIDANSSSTVTFSGRDANGILRDYTPAQLAAAPSSGTLIGRDSNGLLRDYTAAEINATTADTYVENVLADAPVAYWRLGESSGTVANDEVGSYDGTYVATPTLGVAGLTAGDADTAVDFDAASSEYVNIPTSPNPWAGDFSIEAWVKPDGTGAWRVFLANETYGVRGFRLGQKNSAMVFWTSESGGTIGITTGGGFLVAGTTYHVVVTRSGSTFRLYVDGVEIGSSTSTYVTATGSTLIATASGPSSLWDGVIDEVAVYNYALSAARVLAHYNAGRSV